MKKWKKYLLFVFIMSVILFAPSKQNVRADTANSYDSNMQTQSRFPKRTALLPRCRGSGSLLNAGLSIVLLFCYDGKAEKTKKEGKNGKPIHI